MIDLILDILWKEIDVLSSILQIGEMNPDLTERFHPAVYDKEPVEGVKYKYIILLFPKEDVRKYLRLLRWDGKLIIFHLTDIGISDVIEKWSGHYPQEYLMIERLKKDWKLTSSFHQHYIDMSEIFKGNMDETHKILSFIFKCNTRNLSPQLIEEMIRKLKNRCVKDQFLNPIGVIVINGPKSNL